MDKVSPPIEDKPTARHSFYGSLTATVNRITDNVSDITTFAHGLAARVGEIEQSRDREESAKDTINAFLRKFAWIVGIVLTSFGTVIYQGIESRTKSRLAEEQKFKDTQEQHTEHIAQLRAELELLTMQYIRVTEQSEQKDETIEALKEVISANK